MFEEEFVADSREVTSQNEKTTLLANTKKEYASILRWMSFCNSEVLMSLARWFRPLVGRDPYNKKNVEDAEKDTLAAIKVLEDHLLVNTYLVTERLTLADIFCAAIVGRGFQFTFDKKFRDDHPNVTRWYETVYNQPIYMDVVGKKLEFRDEAIKYTPPKKEEKKKQEQPKKEAPKPKPKKEEEDDDEEDEAAAAPKAKHPLEELGRPTFVLDELKRKYSNEETREVALPWFWENANFDEYSLWSMDFKYNEELTMTFMSNNQIGELPPISIVVICSTRILTAYFSRRWLLHSSRRIAQVHFRRCISVRYDERQHHPWRAVRPWSGH